MSKKTKKSADDPQLGLTHGYAAGPTSGVWPTIDGLRLKAVAVGLKVTAKMVRYKRGPVTSWAAQGTRAKASEQKRGVITTHPIPIFESPEALHEHQMKAAKKTVERLQADLDEATDWLEQITRRGTPTVWEP